MKLRFTKMQGCGNDYIYIDCFAQTVERPGELSIQLCDRHFGIGGDGIVLILPSAVADARMRMFNSDGSEGKMCGNAIRCVAKYLYDKGIARKTHLTVQTQSGIKQLFLTIEQEEVAFVTVNMGAAEFDAKKIPVALPVERIINHPLAMNDTTYAVTCLSMGNPHAVVFCPEIESLDLAALGPKFEHNPLFPERINTEFVKYEGEALLAMRVWERGSGETLACGTGACAAVCAAVANGLCKQNAPVTVRLSGGELVIRCTDEAVWMTGECKQVFEGMVEVV